MSLSIDDVKKVARLARLAIPEDQLASLNKDLDRILNLVSQMDREDTSQVAPLAHPYDTTQPLRPDRVTEQNERDLFQSIAPKTKAGLYVVPQVIETE